MAFIAICYMYINLFAVQHIADSPGEYRTSDAIWIQKDWRLITQPIHSLAGIRTHDLRGISLTSYQLSCPDWMMIDVWFLCPDEVLGWKN